MSGVHSFINGGVMTTTTTTRMAPTSTSTSTSTSTTLSRTAFELFTVTDKEDSLELAKVEEEITTTVAPATRIEKTQTGTEIKTENYTVILEATRRKMLRLRVNLKQQKKGDNEDEVQLKNYKTILEATRRKMLGLRLNLQQSKDHNNVTTNQLEEETEIEVEEKDIWQQQKDNITDVIVQIEEKGEEEGELSKAIVAIARNVTGDILSLLRFSAANFLTSSLPEDQRKDLLQRMGGGASPTIVISAATTTTVTDEANNIEPEQQQRERASIQEEIALARAEEAQINEEKWNKGKKEIIKQMEEAANERVTNELQIQKMRIVQELKEQGVREEEEETKKIAATKEGEETKNEKERLKEEERQNRELELLVESKKKQQIALESIEEELRASIEKESEERKRLESLLEKRKGQQAQLDIVEQNLRNRAAGIGAEKEQYEKLSKELDVMKQKQPQPQYEQTNEELTTKTKEEDCDEDDDSNTEPIHPVLGKVIADLGYKRLHFVSAGKLGAIQVWNRNRIYRNSRAQSMANEKIKSMELGFPGAICLHEDDNGKLSIVDGQHRVGMMVALRGMIEKKLEAGKDIEGMNDNTDNMFERVLVEVYSEPTRRHDESESTKTIGDKYVQKVFSEINKAEPVKLIDMPGVASAADRKIITDAVSVLQRQFSPMFSPSQRCRVPNVNVDNLRSSTFGANILKRHKLKTSKQLAVWLLEQNAALGDEYETNNEKQALVSDKQWSKASTNNFYLGLESSWLYK